ncbi:MAG: DUF3488 and transglutaminase-like domain-containing protein, partial [Candidatus Competibacteraceae bacterium]|nr:DUF3488 and transglutaminase-like domain-containing protein [Candidatus Competibacteraceae bacterium]
MAVPSAVGPWRAWPSTGKTVAAERRELDGPVLEGLLLALALAAAPHALHLPVWLTALFLMALGIRYWLGRQGLPLPSRWLLVAVTLVTGAGVMADYGTLLGRQAGVALLAAMAALKLLEARSQRDGMVLVLLGHFLIMAHLLQRQDLPAALHMAAGVVIMMAAQMRLMVPGGRLPARQALGLAGWTLLRALPFMVLLFVLFPRIPGPLWKLPNDMTTARTGLSDQMEPGAISNLIQSGEVAFRVTFDGPVPAQEALYWRGPVLWNFDGRVWRTLSGNWGVAPDYQALGQPLDYTVTLEPHGQRWLFALDLPARIPPRARMVPAYQLLSREPVDEVLRYPMRSYLDYATGPLKPYARRLGLQLPSGGNPRARQLAEDWQREVTQPARRVALALELFRQAPFRYTLSPPILRGADSVDAFLFDSRAGFCEHYAGAFTFLMRAAGVPARVVTGYQGGERNRLSDYWIVRQSDAHAWAEVWLEGPGWVRVDPTAAVAPERVEVGLHAAVGEESSLPLLARSGQDLLRRLALGWDALNNSWTQWVLAYSPQRQQQLLSRLGLGQWQRMVLVLIAGVVVLGLLYMLLLHRRSRRRLDPVAQAWEGFCAKLARRGLVRRPQEGPLAFVERVAAS